MTGSTSNFGIGHPSFHVLYQRWGVVVDHERADWLRGVDHPDAGWAGWTDLLVDFRVASRRSVPLDVLPARVLEWPSRAPGWSLHGAAWVPEHDVLPDGDRVADPVSMIRFTDPEGFRFAFVVSQDKDAEKGPYFAAGRFEFLLPAMRHLFHCADGDLTRAHGPEVRALMLDGFVDPARAYSLPVLRDAVADPARWFGTDPMVGQGGGHWQDLSVDAPRLLTPDRVLLGWASAGAASHAEAADWVAVGLDGAEAAAWRHHHATPANSATDGAVGGATGGAVDGGLGEGWTDSEVRDWFAALGGGRRNRVRASQYRRVGFTVTQSLAWDGLVQPSAAAYAMVTRLEDGGWTREHVNAMRDALPRREGALPWPRSPKVDEVAAWADLCPERALAYVRAGYDAAEAAAMEHCPEPPTTETLHTMASLMAPKNGTP